MKAVYLEAGKRPANRTGRRAELLRRIADAARRERLLVRVQEAVGGAIQERNGRVSKTHDVLMPDPETERDALSVCLGSINGIGDAFSLGVSLPSMDQIVAGICSQVDSYIHQKINDAHNQVLNTVNGLGGNNPFKVYGTSGDYILHLKGKLK